MKYDILGVNVDNATMSEAVAQLSEYIDTTDAHMVVTPNAEILYVCHEDEEIKKIINSASFVAPDGIGVVYAAKSYGTPLKEKVPGCELGYNLLFEAVKKNAGVFLFGAKPGVAEKATEKLTEKLPGLRVVGTHHGYFDSDNEIITNIKEKKPDLLIVCLGSPRQEIWVYENKEMLSGVGAIMCLGGALDVWAGNVKRAPALLIKLRLEWLWRMICEPKRMKNLPLMFKFQCLTRKSRQKG